MWRRALAISAICAFAAAVAPEAPWADPLAYVNGDQIWVATAIPQATLEIPGRGFRVSTLSADGRVAVVADSRGIYLYRVPSEGSWGARPKPTALLRVPDSALANLAGVAVSSDGTTVLVATGAIGNDEAAVYVFHAASPRAWKSQTLPTARLTDAAEPAGFGSGVALSSDGTTALVGTPGGADVFHVATADSWRATSRPTATLVADALGAEVGGVGVAVALSADGTTALIGEMSLHTFVGAAYIFHAVAADAWVSSASRPDAVLTDGVAGLWGDGFGSAVSLSPDGTTALVGAPNIAFGPAGAAYFFQARSPGAWTSTSEPDAAVDRTFVPSGGASGTGTAGHVPGWSVALSDGGTALVGEPSVLGHGAVDLLHVAGPDHSWRFRTVAHAKLTNAAGPPGDLFGAATALSSDGTTALVSSARTSFIYAQASSGGESGCYVPYLEGNSLPAAKRAVESTHCRLGRVTRVRGSRVRSARVTAQRPKPGERLTKGAKVDLSVSNVRNR